MVKITSLSTDKKYFLSCEITMRGHYSTIKSEVKLITALQNAVKSEKNNLVAVQLQKKLDNKEILSLCEFYGIIAKNKIIKYEVVS